MRAARKRAAAAGRRRTSRIDLHTRCASHFTNRLTRRGDSLPPLPPVAWLAALWRLDGRLRISTDLTELLLPREEHDVTSAFRRHIVQDQEGAKPRQTFPTSGRARTMRSRARSLRGPRRPPWLRRCCHSLAGHPNRRECLRPSPDGTSN